MGEWGGGGGGGGISEGDFRPHRSSQITPAIRV